MATNSSKYPTLGDLTTQQLGAGGELLAVVEVLAQSSDVLPDVPFFEGNMETGNKAVIRTGIPNATWRGYYGTVQPTKGSKKAVEDKVAELNAYSIIDMRLLDVAGGASGAMRGDEEEVHILGMGIDAEDGIFYGDPAVNENQFLGLSPRYAEYTNAANSANVIHMGGSSALTSIWFITWGKKSTFGFYGKGAPAGLVRNDRGEQTLGSDTDGYWQAAVTNFHWSIGLTLVDWKGCVRLCNIDSGAANADLVMDFIDAYHAIPGRLRRMGQTIIYCNETILAMLDKQRLQPNTAQTMNLTLGTWGGDDTVFFRNMPIKLAEVLRNNETAVPA